MSLARRFLPYCILALSLMACGKVQDEPAPQVLDKKALEKAAEMYCKEGQLLVEDRASLNVTFDKLTAVSSVFAFSKSTGDCALEKDIDQNWPSEKDPLSFKLKIHRDCLPNHSLWIAEDVPVENPEKKSAEPPAESPAEPPEKEPVKQKSYTLRKFADPSWPAMEMTGSPNLAGSYVGGLTGLRVLICQ